MMLTDVIVQLCVCVLEHRVCAAVSVVFFELYIIIESPIWHTARPFIIFILFFPHFMQLGSAAEMLTTIE